MELHDNEAVVVVAIATAAAERVVDDPDGVPHGELQRHPGRDGRERDGLARPSLAYDEALPSNPGSGAEEDVPGGVDAVQVPGEAVALRVGEEERAADGESRGARRGVDVRREADSADELVGADHGHHSIQDRPSLWAWQARAAGSG